MSEKVLGFYKKDATDECGLGCHWRIEKFVPVVSIEWLEKDCASAVKAIKTIKEETEFDRGFKAEAIQATINVLANAKFDLGWAKFKEEKEQSKI